MAVSGAGGKRLGIGDVTDPALLKGHWKRIRRDVRAPRVQQFFLAADPLEWLPFEYRLDESLNALHNDVVLGTYRAQAPEVIRSAKSLGLTRPLAFLSTRDLLLYRNVVARAEVDLLQVMPGWSRFGRADSKNSPDDREPESGWFRAWLARNGQLWAITENYEWLVETDVSNFFPSVHLDAALDHLLAHTRLGVDVVRLLSHMLREFAPLPEYRVSPVGGLPQESFDCSRIIAHSFLQPVDEEFSSEGGARRYSRYMDDIVIGVSSLADGYTAVARAQSALEKVGLYPNASKTRIINRVDFATDYMKDENDYLGDIDRLGKDGGHVDKKEFSERLKRHLKLTPRPRAWERVLRRYYTASRVLRDQTLVAHAPAHVASFPGSARQILDYLSTFQLTAKRVTRLRSALKDTGALYEDVHLLAMQYGVIAPNIRSELTRQAICDWARASVEASHAVQPRLAASSVILLAKFADQVVIDFLQEFLETSCPRDGGLLRRQLGLALLGLGAVDVSYLRAFAVESDEARVMVDFLSAIESGDNRAVNLTLGAVEPRERRSPRMYMTPPRPMLLAPLALSVIGREADRRRSKWRKLVARSEAGRDRRGEQWLGL